MNINDATIIYEDTLPTDTYHQFCSNIYSQNGEDGIISQLFKELKINSGFCCEFGGGDGITCSNTYNLLKDGRFFGILIEANASLAEMCKTNLKNLSNISILNEFVTAENLTSILDKFCYPRDFDLLSIDIDSYDYEIWKNFVIYKPKIVIIEANSYRDPIFEETYKKPCTSYELFGDPIKANHPDRIGSGASFMSLIKLGLEKGYIPVSFTGNVTFVDKDLIHNLKEFPYKISSNPFDYIDLYTNLCMWNVGNKIWVTNTGLMFNTALRNYYLQFGVKKIDYKWIAEQIRIKGNKIWEL